jgi:hypothetical protein
MQISAGEYEVNIDQLILYSVLTLISIAVSFIMYVHFMTCSDISKNDR